MATVFDIKNAADDSHIRGSVSAEEWQVRVDLAAAYRLVALYGWDDLIFTHLSAKVPGPEHHFLINPYDMMFEEITASSLVKIDVEGNPVVPTAHPVNPAGFTIHSALHMNCPDAGAVMHLHTPSGQAVSAMADGLMEHTQTAMVARADIAYHEYEGIATDLDERERLVADMGDKHFMILRNHGLLTVGKTVGEAFFWLYTLQKACEIQVLAQAGLPAAPAQVFERAGRVFLESERFDRCAPWPDDPAGAPPGRIGMVSLLVYDAQYVGEMDHWAATAQRMQARGLLTPEDARTLRLLDAYGELIGNTDRHYGNISLVLVEDDWHLSPTYDMLPMLYMPIAGEVVPQTLALDRMVPTAATLDVWPQARALAREFWQCVADDARVSQAFREMARAHVAPLAPALP